MIKLLNSSEYIQLCEEIGDDIISLPLCQEYKELRHEIETSVEIKNLIANFERAKQSYAEVERYGGKYHPDYKDVSKRLVEAKTALFQNETVQKFKNCEKSIQSILDEIASYLMGVVEFKEGKKAQACGCKNGSCSC